MPQCGTESPISAEAATGRRPIDCVTTHSICGRSVAARLRPATTSRNRDATDASHIQGRIWVLGIGYGCWRDPVSPKRCRRPGWSSWRWQRRRALDDRDLDTAFPDRGKRKGIASLRYDILKLFIAPGRHQYRACNSCSPMSSRCSAKRLRVGRDTAPAAQRRAATTLISLGVLPLTLSSVDTAPYRRACLSTGQASQPHHEHIGAAGNPAGHAPGR